MVKVLSFSQMVVILFHRLAQLGSSISYSNSGILGFLNDLSSSSYSEEQSGLELSTRDCDRRQFRFGLGPNLFEVPATVQPVRPTDPTRPEGPLNCTCKQTFLLRLLRTFVIQGQLLVERLQGQLIEQVGVFSRTFLIVCDVLNWIFGASVDAFA
jgi:hypothetical protein